MRRQLQLLISMSQTNHFIHHHTFITNSSNSVFQTKPIPLEKPTQVFEDYNSSMMRNRSAQVKAQNLQAMTSTLTEQINRMKKKSKEAYFKEMFSIKPEYKRISSFYPLSKYAEAQPQRKYLPFYKSINKEYLYVRFVHNDGNSFYRSFAFEYLTNVANFSTLSCVTTRRKLKKCRNLPYKLDSLEIEEAMFIIWKWYLFPLEKLNKIKRKKKILDLFNSSYLFDSMFIAFFRALSYNIVLVNEHIKSMVKDESQLQNILTYGYPVHCYEIYGLTQLFSIKITKYTPYAKNYELIPQTIQKGHCAILEGANNGYTILCKEQDTKEEEQEISLRQFLPITHMVNRPAKISSQIAGDLRLFLSIFGVLTFLIIAISLTDYLL